MARYSVTPSATRMAREMIRTIFPCRKIMPEDADSLLNQVTLIALADLLDRRLRWKHRPAGRFRLHFSGEKVEITEPRKGRASVSPVPTDSEVNRALDASEEIFDRYGLDDEERATLFTALPCLALEALSSSVEWDREPPFPELGKD